MSMKTNINGRIIRRGDIFFADLNPVLGSEQGNRRPVVILQNDQGNEHSSTTIVAAITSKSDKPYLPTHVPLKDVPGIYKDSIVLLEQIRTVDTMRLDTYLGSLSAAQMEEIDRAIAVSLGMRI